MKHIHFHSIKWTGIKWIVIKWIGINTPTSDQKRQDRKALLDQRLCFIAVPDGLT